METETPVIPLDTLVAWLNERAKEDDYEAVVEVQPHPAKANTLIFVTVFGEIEITVTQADDTFLLTDPQGQVISYSPNQ